MPYRFTSAAGGSAHGGGLLLLALLSAGATDAEAAVRGVHCVNGPFLTIGDAVAAASPGDTIVIQPCPTGPYLENVVILGVELHLVGASAAGAMPELGAVATGVGNLPDPQVVIDGGGSDLPCLQVRSSDGVTISGLKLQNCAAGLVLIDAFRTHVHGVRSQDHAYAGFADVRGDSNVFSGNVAGRNGFGFVVEQSIGGVLSDNRVVASLVDGISVTGNDMLVVNNDVMTSAFVGLRVLGGTGNRILRNTSERNGLVAPGAANLAIDPAATDTVVVGNAADGNLQDTGVGSQVFVNQ
jgi:hypothetical protein